MSAPWHSSRLRTFLIGALIVAIGVAGSVLLASEWRASSLHANRKSFEATVADLSGTLAARLQTKVELTRAMRSIATLEPNAGDTRYVQWYRQLQRGAPTPPDVTAVFIQAVPAAELPAFRAQAEADPTARKALHGSFQIVPSGRPPVLLPDARHRSATPAGKPSTRRCSTTARRSCPASANRRTRR